MVYKLWEFSSRINWKDALLFLGVSLWCYYIFPIAVGRGKNWKWPFFH